MRKTVLIVEDFEHSATPLEIALSSLSGIDVVTVSTAREALHFFDTRAGEIAALVTDIHLPVMDGFELIERIRSDERYAHLPIVAITGDSHPDTPRRLLHIGASAYFPKPYSPAEIKKRLEHLINAH